MSRPDDFHDFHDPAREDLRRDALTLAALGEPVDPDFTRHERHCAVCQADLAGLTRTVALARGGAPAVPSADVRPPDSVWDGIARELRLPDRVGPSSSNVVATPTALVPAPPSDTSPGTEGRRRRGPRTWLLAAAAVIAVAAAGMGGFLVGREDAGTGDCPSASAELSPADGTAADAGGRAELVCSPDGPALRVTTERLPLGTGYYEVWMYQPSSGVMVAVGALGADGSGTFTLPGGMDVHDYPVVDVSAQRYDGGPAHDRSVLQGPLTS